MMEIDVEVLHNHLMNLCGTTMAGGLGLAMLAVIDVERAGERELTSVADEHGVDFRLFAIQ